MMPDLKTLLGQVWSSIARPRDVARWVMSFDMPLRHRWEVLLLVVVLSVIAAHVSIVYIARAQAFVMGELVLNPWTTGLLQLTVLVAAVFAVQVIGRAMGGQGRLQDAILLVAWLQFCLLCLQVVQTLFLMVMPPIAGLIGIAGFVLFFWLLSNFVAEMHGFRSLGLVFAMIIVSLLSIIFALSLILTLLGFAVPGASFDV
ncbi:MAG: hypothetical protein CMH12_04415 [Maritimibacter sp.]|nr:hypothetical protein [Maritimibacter sp.]